MSRGVVRRPDLNFPFHSGVPVFSEKKRDWSPYSVSTSESVSAGSNKRAQVLKCEHDFRERGGFSVLVRVSYVPSKERAEKVEQFRASGIHDERKDSGAPFLAERS